MIEAILVVLTKAVPGREADLDDWYSHIHIRDALRFRGSVTAQRFKRSASSAAPNSPRHWRRNSTGNIWRFMMSSTPNASAASIGKMR